MAAQAQHQQWAGQHLAYLHQTSAHPPARIVHQQRPQMPGDHSPWQAEAALEAYLRQQKLSQGLAGSQPL